ncbi:Acg family FMN-binding oxidoreductase [Plantactinospora sp. WMMB334]|uniref:Acg family FMN-binding oxidoreductase n=1 Tax=Plantactinospora sp. WMMB334 TaxID=3404119 RepID=UPI003B934F2F
MAGGVRRIPRLSAEVVAECLRTATAAPSIHNTQPWLFRVRGREIEVWADRRRQLSVLDPDGRQMFISLGAAIFNLRVAMLTHGRIPVLHLLPEPGSPELAARIQAGPTTAPSATAAVLAAAIPRRHTNRRPFQAAAVPWPVLDDLISAAAAEGSRLTVADPIVRDAILSLTSVGDELLNRSPAYHAELAAWAGGGPRRDGIPAYAFPPQDTTGRLPLRRFGPSSGSDAFERPPTLVRLTTSGDMPYDWIRAGQAIQRVLLTATARRLDASPINQALEVAELRRLVGGQGHAQMVLRIGYGEPSRGTLRRALVDVLDDGEWSRRAGGGPRPRDEGGRRGRRGRPRSSLAVLSADAVDNAVDSESLQTGLDHGSVSRCHDGGRIA